MVNPKVSKSTPRSVAQPHHGHSLAPEHLGESGAAAALVGAIGGIAIFIAAVAMTIGGMTLSSRYAGSTAPPNVGQLGMSQVVGGIGLLLLGVLIVASAGALLAGMPRSRPLTAAVLAITAALAAIAFIMLLGATRRDDVLLASLGVAFLAFGSAAFVLVRPRR